MNMEDIEEKTYACKICGRKFIKSSLVIHESACKKLSKLARKPFDSGKQRASGSDIPINAVRKAQKEKEKHGGTFPRPKTHWRQRHEEFIGAVAGAKHVEMALKTGAPLPPPPKSSYNPDYIQCDYCGRRFNATAAERHIPFCREQHARTAGRAPPSRAPRTGNKPLTRSQSQPRTPQQPRSPSTSANRRPSTKTVSPGNVTASGNRTPSTKSGNRPTANSAGVSGIRTTHLPTPVKRSTSAPRTAHAQKTPGTGYSTMGQSNYAPPTTASRKSIPSSSGTYKPPSTAKSTASASSGRRTSSTRRRDY